MNRWQIIQDLFEEVLDLGPEERARVLAERSAGDAGLRQEVQDLLDADGAPLDGFEQGAGHLFLALRNEADPQVLCGVAFGAYEVEAHLSSGGMAHVYRATRTSAGTSRRVALKVMRTGLDTEACSRRFQQEREMLAGLEHESIVAFLDAGAVPDGRPFLAMEFIDGQSLVEWSRSASRVECLQLFQRILRTLQYAHQRLIVHRDLKPSNILVTSQGTPKLLDFGVAERLAPIVEANLDQDPMTPGYASPEQRRGEPLTTASDLYSMGLILHELLCGRLPGPSAALDRSRLDGQLLPILEKALAEDLRVRYVTADQFARDLDHYLRHEPHSAGPHHWPARARLFLRRHRWPVALSSLVLIVLGLGWVNSDLDRRLAQQEASMGWSAHAQAKAVARIFEERIAAEELSQRDDTLRYLEGALRQGTSDMPEAEALLRMTLAGLYLERGEAQLAEPHALRAYELAQVTRGIGKGDLLRATRLLETTRDALAAGNSAGPEATGTGPDPAGASGGS